jgi:hypothetical protein
MSTKQLRARLDRLAAWVRPGVGRDPDRDRRRREELRIRKLDPGGLTSAEEIEYAQLDALFQEEDRDRDRRLELAWNEFEGQELTDAERLELAEIEKRLPPDPPLDDEWQQFVSPKAQS